MVTTAQQNFKHTDKEKEALRFFNMSTSYEYRSDRVSAVEFYEGWAEEDLPAQPIWLLKRTITLGNKDFVTWAIANDCRAEFQHIWDNRIDIFGGSVFANMQSFLFDGVNDHILTPHNAIIDFDRLEPHTTLLWINTVKTSAVQILWEKTLTNDGRFADILANGDLRIEIRGTGGTGDRLRIDITPDVDIRNGRWHLVGVSYDGSSNASGLRAYIDGVEQTVRDVVTDGLLTTTLNGGDIGWGSNSVGNSPRFEGFLDQPAIFNADFTLADHEEAYDAGFATDYSQHSNQSGNLVLWYDFETPLAHPIIPDRSGNSLDGTAFNTLGNEYKTEIPNGP